MQVVHLLFDKSPDLDGLKIAQRASEILKLEVELPPSERMSSINLHFLFRAEGESPNTIPTQAVVFATETRPSANEIFEEIIEQSWSFDDAEEVAKSANYAYVINDFMGLMTEPAERLRRFHGLLQAVVEQSQPLALAFAHTCQIVGTSQYLDACDQEPILRPGSLNVRFFNVLNSKDNEMLMDVRGLEEIGLQDLQCHFKKIDPKQVAAKLYDMAYYIFKNGTIVESGHTIEGIDSGSRWKCQLEESMVPPKRMLMDLAPGTEASGGGRKKGWFGFGK